MIECETCILEKVVHYCEVDCLALEDALKEHDEQIRADAIEEYRKEMHDMIEGNEEFIDWQKYEILECNELVAEQLNEQTDEITRR